MTKIYFAGPLFSQADLRYNAYLVEQIRQLDKTIDLYLPQENAAINDKMEGLSCTFKRKVF